MTNPVPRTRRQLREALKQAEHALDEQRVQTRYAERKLRQVGAVEGNCLTVSYGYGQRIERRTWDISSIQRDPNKIYTQADFDERHEATAIETRRETLAAVIDALELREYRDETPGVHEQLYAIATNAATPAPGADRFWSDIQTALEVRAEQKRAEERKATEAKIAGFKPVSKTVIGSDPAGGMSVFASIHDIDRIAEPAPTTKPAKKKSEGKK